MRSRPHIFWQSLGLTLLLMLPMAALVLFFVGKRAEQNQLRQVAAGAVLQIEPGAQSTHRLLLVVQQEQPEFVLLRVDAPAGAITFCGLPGQLQLNAPAGTTTLADCTLAAGPGRAAQLLSQTLAQTATPETATSAPAADLGYLAATPATWETMAGSAATARFDTAALLPGVAKSTQKTGDSVLNLTPATAGDAIAALQRALDTPAAKATARAAVWTAFARQDPVWLANLPAALRQNSARTLTSLRAQDIADLADTLDYLAATPGTEIDYQTLAATAGNPVTLTEQDSALLCKLLR